MSRTRLGRRKPALDKGAVTVEAAVAMASFVTVLALVLASVSASIDQLRCIDAAREAARLVARGEPDLARATAKKLAPDNATVDITVRDDTIQVDVRSEPVAGLLPGLSLHGSAFAISEPGTVEDQT
jgi:hypothetical protein